MSHVCKDKVNILSAFQFYSFYNNEGITIPSIDSHHLKVLCYIFYKLLKYQKVIIRCMHKYFKLIMYA